MRQPRVNPQVPLLRPYLVLQVVVSSLLLATRLGAAEEALYSSRDLTPPGGFQSPEGPAADADGILYAVNFDHRGTIGRIAPAGAADIFVELPGGSIGNGIRFDSHGAMLIADYKNHNVLSVDMATRAVTVVAHEPAMNQPNDLAIGANDVLYASDPDWGEGTGQLWRVTPDGVVSLLEDGMGTTNGIEVSPGDQVLYVNETFQRTVWAYDLSPGGEVSNKRLFIRFDGPGLDGMRCDVAGNLYVTRIGGGRVTKLSPAGEVLLEVDLTGEDPTNIAFGGPDGRTCYVTVADRRNIETFRVEEPGRSWQLRQDGGTPVQPRSWARIKAGAAAPGRRPETP